MADLEVGSGWLYLTNATNYMLVYFKNCKWDFKFQPTIRHFAGASHLGYDTQKRWLEWKFTDIILETHTKFSTFVDTLKDWQSSAPFTLSVKRDNTPNYIEFDGDNTTYTVLMPSGFKDWEKVAPGTQDGPYICKLLVFTQCG